MSFNKRRGWVKTMAQYRLLREQYSAKSIVHTDDCSHQIADTEMVFIQPIPSQRIVEDYAETKSTI